jgi:tetratricopeptide (TPR) repeat protein
LQNKKDLKKTDNSMIHTAYTKNGAVRYNSTAKRLITFALLLCTVLATAQNEATASMDTLDYYLERQTFFDRQKEAVIAGIKAKIDADRDNPTALYPLYLQLFDEYRSYVYDSAYLAAERLLELARILDDRDKIIASQTKIGYCYFASGLFKEAFEQFSSIDVTECSDTTKIEYYICESTFYYNLADYNNSDDFRRRYNAEGNRIIDRAIALLPEASLNYWYAVGLRRMKSGDMQGAVDAYLKMLASSDCSEHDRAVATSSIAYLLGLQGNTAGARHYLIEAAVADIKSSTKETVALRNLAALIHAEGDVRRATGYIHHALTDALFYNTRHRQLEAGLLLSIIEGERISMIEKQRNTVVWVSAAIALLALLLLVTVVYLRQIMKRLNDANRKVQETNERLNEANKIKEEYIGDFFSQNSEFIEKLGSLQKWVVSKANARACDELKTFPKNLNVQRERENMFARFDQIFLKLFPDFVKEFNKLLKPEGQITLQSGELLNTDLRIYALMRLGIRENEKIAAFLDYSINTIYTYKSKIKSRSLYPNEELKRRLMEIK